MTGVIDVAKFKKNKSLKGRYSNQLKRLAAEKIETDCIQKAVAETLANLASAKTSLVIYGEPQSGKTEMMICLTAKLLDEGHATIVHLMNDSVDLLTQNLRRFKHSGLAPAPRGLSELLQSSKITEQQELVVFCKKNHRDLEKLIERLKGRKKVLVIDDEADHATPNAKINKGKKTKINNLVGKLIGGDGYYIGVTATPARLDLNNTFQNETEKWVSFPPHSKYTGQKVFFPLDKKVSYRRSLLKGDDPKQAKDALIRFLVSVAYLNLYVKDKGEQNYTMLVHTSGSTEAHEADRTTIEESVQALIDTESAEFEKLVTQVHKAAQVLYPDARSLAKLRSRSVDVIITSPPYLNAIDYLRGHRLSLVWLGYRLHQIRAFRSGSIGTENGGRADLAPKTLAKLLRGAGAVHKLPPREIGMVERYAQDVLGFLKELIRVAKKGAKLLLVVGNSRLKNVQISNARINITAAKMVGFKFAREVERKLPTSSRYLPPPSAANSLSLSRRMRTESLLSFSVSH